MAFFFVVFLQVLRDCDVEFVCHVAFWLVEKLVRECAVLCLAWLYGGE